MTYTVVSLFALLVVVAVVDMVGVCLGWKRWRK